MITKPMTRKESFEKNRIPWKHIQRKFLKLVFVNNSKEEFEQMVLLEILKELQYLNDKKVKQT
jgi:hypothetical protein